MSGRLPAQIDPIRLADEGARLTGELPLSELPRLSALACAGLAPEPVSVDLVFEHTVQGVRLMRGRLHVRLPVTCQRCLEPVTVELVAQPFSELLAPGATPVQPGDTEALVVDGPVRLGEIVEEELLLVMPMVPMHDEGECTAPGAASKAAPVAEKQSGPFSALRERWPKDQQN